MVIRKIKKLFYLVFSFFDKGTDYLDYQNTTFENENLNRNLGLEELTKLKSQYDNINFQMESEHHVIFSSISQKFKEGIKSILEIGTHDGSNVFLLSKMFPNSQIDTIDLPREHKNFVGFYGRDKDNTLKNFLDTRYRNLKLTKNVNFKEINSIRLLNEEKTYDLIWIDGAHGYPFVTIDIMNSLKLINRNGLILCDDVIVNELSLADKMYRSNASHETIQELKEEGLINYSLFLKRLEKKFNYFPEDKKYIALIKKI